MTAVILRIVLRYVAGALVAKGLFDPAFGDFLVSDPDIAAAIQVGGGVVLGAIVEGAYALAKRWRWTT